MGAGYSIKARANASAEIYIYEDVGEGWFGGVSAKQFAADLKGLGAVDTIDLRINSGGGNVFDGLAMYRQLVDHKARVITHIDGIAASIASVIAMAGDEIEISEAGFIMIHNASAVAVGGASDMRKMADLLETVTGTIADVYVARTGVARDEVLAMMDAETWLAATDAVEQGFAGRVAENMRIAAWVDPKHSYRRVPQNLSAAVPTSAAGPRPLFDGASDTVKRMRAHISRRRAEGIRTA